jgi:cell wall assembly regulator SMI1
VSTDIDDVWERITDWLTRHAPVTHGALNAPASADELAAAEQELGFELPAQLRAWWLCNDGVQSGFDGQVLPGYMPYSVGEMRKSRRGRLEVEERAGDAELAEDSRRELAGGMAWSFLPEFIPIAWNGSGDDLVVDLRHGPLRGCVKEYSHEEGALHPPLWTSLAAMLADVARALETGSEICDDFMPVVQDGVLDWEVDGFGDEKDEVVDAPERGLAQFWPESPAADRMARQTSEYPAAAWHRAARQIPPPRPAAAELAEARRGELAERERRDAEFAASATVTHRADAADGEARPCRFTPYPRNDPADYGGVFAVDATGEYVVAASRGGIALTLWKQGRPTDITIEGRRSALTAVAVNSAGMIAGWDQTAPTYNWIHHNGVTTTLRQPTYHTSSVVRQLNERGDALGWLNGGAGLVVWPARAPDQPRAIAGAGLEPLAIRGDGTVIAFQQAPAGVVVFRPDATNQFQAAPAGVRADMTSFVRGDMLFTSAASHAAPAAGRGRHPVRWNLRTGSVDIFTGITGAVRAGNSGGWMAVQHTGRPGSCVITPDGGISDGPTGRVSWISTDGRTMIGTAASGPGAWTRD